MPARTFQHIAVAVALSPRREALLAEARHLAKQLGADLTVIHVGQATEHLQAHLEALMDRQHFGHVQVHLRMPNGNPAEAIATVCQEEAIDLLIIGALRARSWKERLGGTLAQRIIRKVPCSVLLLPLPSKLPANPKEMIVGANLGDTPSLWIDQCLRFAQQVQVKKIHILQGDDGKHEAWGTNQSSLSLGGNPTDDEFEFGHTNLNQLIDDTQARHNPESSLKPEVHTSISTKASIDFTRLHSEALFATQIPSPSEMGAFWRITFPLLGRLIAKLPCRLLMLR